VNSSSGSRGGKREGSGRTRLNLHLDRETAIWLRLLALRWGVSEDQAVKRLVKAEMKKIDEVEAAVRAEIDARLKSE
jgi:hypothetical protein